MNKNVRVRIAPSPTGKDLHIGNIYTALINYVFAKKHNGSFIVRIEDTDQKRLVKGSKDKILSSLSWLGLNPDESPQIQGNFGPYRQSKRLDIYKKYAKELIKKKHAYYCFCTPERLSEMRKNQQKSGKPPIYDRRCRELNPACRQAGVKKENRFVIRLKVPKQGITAFNDVIRGNIEFNNRLIDDQILLKSDGFPTYHLAVVVDDHLMKISHVIRAEEWISSTPKHVILYKSFGWKLPVFAHLPLLRNTDKSKLSKRRNPVWASWYKKHGFSPKAILNYLATLGWAVPQEIIKSNKAKDLPEEIFTLDEMVKHLKLDSIQASAPIFDIEKLKWMNGIYIRQLSVNKLNSKLKTQNSKLKEIDNAFLEKIIPLVQERMKTLSEFEDLAGFFFEAPKKYENQVNKKWMKEVIEAFSNISWNHEIMLSKGRELAEKLDVKFRKLAMDIRIAITGKKIGPPLFESMEILGKAESLERLNKSIS